MTTTGRRTTTVQGDGVDPRFARSVSRWLVAYPARWRWVRADEVTAVLADLAVPGATRLGVRSGVGLVVAGLRTRHRMAPPLHVRLGYLVLDLRVKPQYRPWVDDVIRGPYSMSQLYGVLLYLGLWVWGKVVLDTEAWSLGFALWMSALFVLAGATRAEGQRLRQAANHLVPQPGETPVPGGYVRGWVHRERMEARSGAPLVLLLTVWVAAWAGMGRLVTGAVDVPGSAWPRSTRPLALPPGAFAVAVAVGVVVALVGLARWRRGLDRLPDQPARLVVPLTRRQRRKTAAWGAFLAVSSALSVVSDERWMNDALLACCLLVLPWALAAWWRTRRPVPAGCALVDLRHLALRRGAGSVDGPVASAVIWEPGTTLAEAAGTVVTAPEPSASPIVVAPFGPSGPTPA
jgi:uncharacterized membrane protein (UPF0136 family)